MRAWLDTQVFRKVRLIVPRILGVDIPKEKRIDASLCYIYGIGQTLASRILETAGIEPNKRAKNVTEEEVLKITAMCLVDAIQSS